MSGLEMYGKKSFVGRPTNNVKTANYFLMYVFGKKR